MNDVAELKEYTRVHARALAIAGYPELLSRIHTDDGDAPGAWTGEWCRTAAQLESRGAHLRAARHYAMARFPFVDGPARAGAQQRSVDAFDRWRAGRGIERLRLSLPGGTATVWTAGLGPDRPVLLVCGGIVTLKEQWAPILVQARRLGLAGVVAELPGVGENTQTYAAESWRLVPALLDALAGRADVDRTWAMALSFSGHLLLRAAAADQRIRGIVTAGAPVRDFFTDRAWQAALPGVTVATLAHLAGTTPDHLGAELSDWALTPEQLAAVTVPVRYVVSDRDEIIPGADPALLARCAPDVRLLHHDDVHGSPGHVPATRAWSLLSLLEMTGGHRVQRAMLSVLVRLLHRR
ncbi:alpha/beta hydrolase [Micromonospora sp. NPDC048898]|uniref:alpha/beta hydrolase n=1 Tax=Micromonospora sp. NPDC048898 TaxID=3364260 RepID=UPI0037155FA2